MKKVNEGTVNAGRVKIGGFFSLFIPRRICQKKIQIGDRKSGGFWGWVGYFFGGVKGKKYRDEKTPK